MDFSEAFNAILSVEKLAKTVDSVLKKSKGHQRAILREMQENIHLLFWPKSAASGQKSYREIGA